MQTRTEFFDSYCYGPADILDIHKGDSTMWISLVDSAGKHARAIYRGCVYWQLDHCHSGLHLSLVQKFTARQLLMQHKCSAMIALQKNTDNIAALLEEWEADGLSFYLHSGNFQEDGLLVAARRLDYLESD